MNKKNFIKVLILIFLLSLSIIGCNKSKKHKNISYITYENNYNLNFQNYLVQQYGNSLNVFNSNSSSSIANANLQSAINSKSDYIIIDYPDQNICISLANKLISNKTDYIIINQTIDNYNCASVNKDKLLKDINKNLNNNSEIEICIGLYSSQKSTNNYYLIYELYNNVISKFTINQNKTSLTFVNPDEIYVEEYLNGIINDVDSKIILICENEIIAKGVLNYAVKNNIKQNLTLIINDINDESLFADISNLSIEYSYDKITLSNKSSELKYSLYKNF